jgi:hypothetical protein
VGELTFKPWRVEMVEIKAAEIPQLLESAYWFEEIPFAAYVKDILLTSEHTMSTKLVKIIWSNYV